MQPKSPPSHPIWVNRWTGWSAAVYFVNPAKHSTALAVSEQHVLHKETNSNPFIIISQKKQPSLASSIFFIWCQIQVVLHHVIAASVSAGAIAYQVHYRREEANHEGSWILRRRRKTRSRSKSQVDHQIITAALEDCTYMIDTRCVHRGVNKWTISGEQRIRSCSSFGEFIALATWEESSSSSHPWSVSQIPNWPSLFWYKTKQFMPLLSIKTFSSFSFTIAILRSGCLWRSLK